MKQLTIERILEIVNISWEKKQAGEISQYVFNCIDDITDWLLNDVFDNKKTTLNKRNFLRRFSHCFSPHELNSGLFAQAWATIKQANKLAEATK